MCCFLISSVKGCFCSIISFATVMLDAFVHIRALLAPHKLLLFRTFCAKASSMNETYTARCLARDCDHTCPIKSVGDTNPRPVSPCFHDILTAAICKFVSCLLFLISLRINTTILFIQTDSQSQLIVIYLSVCAVNVLQLHMLVCFCKASVSPSSILAPAGPPSRL